MADIELVIKIPNDIYHTDEYKKKRLEFVKYLESNPDVVCWH